MVNRKIFACNLYPNVLIDIEYGKMRTTLTFALDAAQADIEKEVLANDIVQKWLEGKEPKKIIFVKGKMINVVI